MSKKIMIIDDEILVIKSISKLLQKEGHEVILCSSGEEALQKIEEHVVDLIISDVRMPGMSGVETVKKLREKSKALERKPVPEIFITGYAEEEANEELKGLKVADYIYKPFDVPAFLKSVNENLKDNIASS